jgi:hypothetical protein
MCSKHICFHSCCRCCCSYSCCQLLSAAPTAATAAVVAASTPYLALQHLLPLLLVHQNPKQLHKVPLLLGCAAPLLLLPLVLPAPPMLLPLQCRCSYT